MKSSLKTSCSAAPESIAPAQASDAALAARDTLFALLANAGTRHWKAGRYAASVPLYRTAQRYSPGDADGARTSRVLALCCAKMGQMDR